MNRIFQLGLPILRSRRRSHRRSRHSGNMSVQRENRGEQGVTLLDALVAMVVIAVVAVVITPPIFLVVATRVQNRRAEQALQIAQGEIDRIRVLVDQVGYDGSNLPDSIGVGEVQTHGAATALAAESASSSNDCAPYDPLTTTISADQLLSVDVDGDCQVDYLVQTFRNAGEDTVANPGVPVTFDIGVRVYHAVATDQVGNLEIEQASLKLATGQGSQRTFPLAVSYTTIIKGETQFSLDEFRDSLNN